MVKSPIAPVLFAFLLLLLAAPAVGAQTPVAQTATSVGVEVSDTNRMLAKVMIGDSGPYSFIVDTGAERSVISSQLSRELGLQSAGRARLLSMTSTREFGMVRVPDVSFMQGEKNTLRAFAIDGRHLGAAGILGIDVLKGRRVLFDFETQQMHVAPAPQRAAAATARDEIVVRGRSKFGQLILADSTAEGQVVDVIVDSGMEVSVGNKKLRELLTARQSRFEPLTLMSVTGETYQADYTRVDKLRIGGVAMTNLPVSFAHAHFFNQMKLTKRPALMLGMDALRAFRRVAIDFEHRRAYFLLPEGAPFLTDLGDLK